MLKELPKVGQILRGLYEELEDGITKNKLYEIKGYHIHSNNPYFINDYGNKSHIDNEVFNLFELVAEDKKPRVNIGLTGIEIDGEYYVEDPTKVKISLSVVTHPDYLLKVLDELHEDIAKLLRDKYQL